jgi:hypothetical protein
MKKLEVYFALDEFGYFNGTHTHGQTYFEKHKGKKHAVLDKHLKCFSKT